MVNFKTIFFQIGVLYLLVTFHTLNCFKHHPRIVFTIKCELANTARAWGSLYESMFAFNFFRFNSHH